MSPSHLAATALHPAMQDLLDVTRVDAAVDDLTIAERRQLARLSSDANFYRFAAPGPPPAIVEPHTIPTASGGVEALIYRPRQHGRLPAHLFAHGGAWWAGSIHELINDAIARRRCVDSGVVVISVEYRLAPEHRYPAAVNDLYDALVWIHDNADELGIDATNLSLGGISAGANLIASTTLVARDHGGPRVVFQLLEVPALDLTLSTARDTIKRLGGTAIDAPMIDAINMYVGQVDAADPRISPLLAADLTRLPPAVVITAEHDPLRTDGTRYAQRLRDAGVAATHLEQPGATHAANILTRAWPPALDWANAANRAVSDAHDVPRRSRR